MLKTSFASTITVLSLSWFVLLPSPAPAQTAELADRDGLESVWKRSGRTTGVIDYPFSPQPGIYGGKTVREWGNRGYIFVNPRTDEFTRRRTHRELVREEAAVEAEDCREVREELLEEVTRGEQLRQEKDRLAAELEKARDVAGDRALKIEALEFQIEELERALLAEARKGEGALPGEIPGPGGEGAGETMTYMVREGDSLWKIAGRPEVYNDPYRWLLLYHANRDQIFLPDLIYPGMVLLVPRYPELEEEKPAGEIAPTATPEAGKPAAPPEEGPEITPETAMETVPSSELPIPAPEYEEE